MNHKQYPVSLVSKGHDIAKILLMLGLSTNQSIKQSINQSNNPKIICTEINSSYGSSPSLFREIVPLEFVLPVTQQHCGIALYLQIK